MIPDLSRASWLLRPLATAFLTLTALLAFGVAAHAHGVDTSDAGYIAEITGINLLP